MANQVKQWIGFVTFIALACQFVHAATLQFRDDGSYTGLTEIYIARDALIGGGTPLDPSTDSYALDQVWLDQNGAGSNTFGLAVYDFDNIFGGATGQVPLGFEIVSASLSIHTGTSGTAGTLNDPRVFGAALPINVSTTYQDLSGHDATQQASEYLYGTESGYLTAVQEFWDGHNANIAQSFDVTQYVRAVTAGDIPVNNFALAVTNIGTDGYQLFTSNASSPGSRPTLTIEYDTSRYQHVQTLDSNDAQIVQMARAGADQAFAVTSGTVWLDGGDSVANDPNGDVVLDQALVRFDLANVLPAGAVLQEARLIAVTADASGFGPSGDTNNVDAGIAVRQMLVDWDLDPSATLPTLPSEFGSTFGIQWTEGEASGNLTEGYVDMNGNFFDGTSITNKGLDSLLAGEEYAFDVTDIVQNWIDGDPNYGFLLHKLSTDGWGINAQDVQLQLSYTTIIPEPASMILLAAGCTALLGRRRR